MDFSLPTWLYEVGRTLTRLLPGGILVAWCLWAVNWRRLWPVLADGGWAPLVLIGLMAAACWSLIWPVDAVVFGFLRVPNGLWQVGSAGVLIGVALFCGWLQTRWGWSPPEIVLEPPAHAPAPHGHDDHGHAEPAPAVTNGPPTH